MDCSKIKEMIPLYMDNMLNEEEMSEITQHLQLCGDCNKVHDEISRITGKLNEIPSLTIPSEFQWKVPQNHIVEKIKKNRASDKGDKRKFLGMGWRTFSSVAAVLVLSVMLSSGVIEMGTLPPEEPGAMMSMARSEDSDKEIIWKDVQNIKDEEAYYTKKLYDKLGPEIQIEASNKDDQGLWHFSVRVDQGKYGLDQSISNLDQEDSNIDRETSNIDGEPSNIDQNIYNADQTLYKYEGKDGEIWIEK